MAGQVLVRGRVDVRNKGAEACPSAVVINGGVLSYVTNGSAVKDNFLCGRGRVTMAVLCAITRRCARLAGDVNVTSFRPGGHEDVAVPMAVIERQGQVIMSSSPLAKGRNSCRRRCRVFLRGIDFSYTSNN